MSDSIKIGSTEWLTTSADKVIETGLSILKVKLAGVDDTAGNQAVYKTYDSGKANYLPYVIGAVVVGGIVLILAKR